MREKVSDDTDLELSSSLKTLLERVKGIESRPILDSNINGSGYPAKVLVEMLDDVVQ